MSISKYPDLYVCWWMGLANDGQDWHCPHPALITRATRSHHKRLSVLLLPTIPPLPFKNENIRAWWIRANVLTSELNKQERTSCTEHSQEPEDHWAKHLFPLKKLLILKIFWERAVTGIQEDRFWNTWFKPAGPLSQGSLSLKNDSTSGTTIEQAFKESRAS